MKNIVHVKVDCVPSKRYSYDELKINVSEYWVYVE